MFFLLKATNWVKNEKLTTCFSRNVITFFNEWMKTKYTTFYKKTGFSPIANNVFWNTMSVSGGIKYNLCFIKHHSLFAGISFDMICSLKLFCCQQAFHRSVIRNEILMFNSNSAMRHYILCVKVRLPLDHSIYLDIQHTEYIYWFCLQDAPCSSHLAVLTWLRATWTQLVFLLLNWGIMHFKKLFLKYSGSGQIQ